MRFLQTNDGLIAAKYVIRIGKPEHWPHGTFYPISYQHGGDALETRATEDDVQDFLDSNTEV